MKWNQKLRSRLLTNLLSKNAGVHGFITVQNTFDL